MARGWMAPGEFKEVVQIGAVKLDAQTLAPLDEFDILVVPRINRSLSPYLESLTGITNDMLAAQGVDLVDAYDRFLAFAAGGMIAAFGRDDLVLAENLRLYGIRDLRALPPFQDLRRWFAACGVDPRGLNSCEIAGLLGVDFQGRAHNALDDARSIAAGMAVMASRGARIAA
jgi:inhibitor of KinA sporulation pathway (predicted exonuclease)